MEKGTRQLVIARHGKASIDSHMQCDKTLYKCASFKNVSQDLNWDPEVHQAVLIIPTFIFKKHNGAIHLRNNAARCACGEEIGHTQRNKRPHQQNLQIYTPFSSKWTRILAGMPIFKYLFRNPEGHDIQHLTPGPQIPSSCSLPTET